LPRAPAPPPIRAVDNDPYDLDAVDLASGFAIEQGDVDASAAMLTRLLTAKDDRPPSQLDRRAALSARLGHARAQRGDGPPGRRRLRARASPSRPAPSARPRRAAASSSYSARPTIRRGARRSRPTCS